MPYCKVLDHHMCATVGGRWRPCCAFRESWKPDEIHWIEDHSFIEYRNSDYYQNIKSSMENGWHEGCIKCQEEESRGQKSHRQKYDKLMPKGEGENVEFIEISLSGECNIACRMCYPGASTTWQKLYDNNPDLHQFRNKARDYTANIADMFAGMDLSNLSTIKLLGGEPFITPQTTDLFEYFESRDDVDLSNVTLLFNTNATFFPKKLLYIMKKFKRFSASISIDGYEKNNDYVRSGSKWDQVMDVTRQWIDFKNTYSSRSAIRFTTCISAYNIHEIHKIGYLAEELNIQFGQSFIQGPAELRIEALPQDYIDYLIDLYENSRPFTVTDSTNSDFMLKYLKSVKPDINLNKRLVNFTEVMDNATGLRLDEYNPTLSKYLNLYN